MSRTVSLLLLLSTISCTNLEPSHQGQLLTLEALQQAERIIPTPAGYLLVERKVFPQNEESGRQLLLYDAQGKYQEAITLFGTVQEVNQTSLVINHTQDFYDYTASASIGSLAIAYHNPTRQSKGGGNAGSFLVDSMRYNAQTRRVLVYAKEPLHQFVTTPYDLRFEQARFTRPVHFYLSLQTVSFRTDYFRTDSISYFLVTSWIEENQTDSTVAYYVSDKQVIKDLLQQIVNAQLASNRHSNLSHR